MTIAWLSVLAAFAVAAAVDRRGKGKGGADA